MVTDPAYLILILCLPISILACTQRITAWIWVALYLASIISGVYLENAQFSILWILDLGIFVTSIAILALFTLVLSPAQRWIVSPLLLKTRRDSGCTGIDLENTYDSKEGEDFEIDIVAVNGLGAHPEFTWRAEASSQDASLGTQDTSPDTQEKRYASWLREWLPHDFPNARIMSFRQDTSYLLDAPVKSIEECGQQLLNEMIRSRRTTQEKKRPILFIGHSFGGIVTKQALVLAAQKEHQSPARAILESTFGILFLGTPHNGAWPSVLGQLLIDCTSWSSSCTEIMDDLGYESTTLRQLADDFAKSYRGEAICIYETKKTRMHGLVPLLVVNQSSATMIGKKKVPLDTDHSGLNKFATRNAHYNTVVEQLRILVDSWNRKDDDRIKECLEALSPVNFKSARNDIKTPVSNTCGWVEGYVNRFCRNLHTSTRALVLNGGPGVGKSILSRYIMDYLERKGTRMRYFIFRHGRLDSEAMPAIRTLVFQLLDGDYKLYPHIREYFEKNSPENPWDLDQLLDVFQKMMLDDRSRSTVVVIDALNECSDKSRKLLMEKLFHFDRRVTSHFIITTQLFTWIWSGFPKYSSIDLAALKEVENDVKTVIEHEVARFFQDEYQDEIQRPETNFEAFEQSVLLSLEKKAGNMFLLVFLYLDRLRNLEASSEGHILEELECLPTDLIPLYEALFTRKLEKHQEAINQKLPWILYAKRPLGVDELRDALAIQDFKRMGTRIFESWKSKRLPEDLRLTFDSLVTIKQSSGEIHLSHDSLRNFLLGQPEPASKMLRDICRSAREEHAEIAAACLYYLALDQFNVPVIQEESLISQHPFLLYSAQNWPHHAREAGEDNSNVLKAYNALLDEKQNFELAFNIYTSNIGFEMGRNMPVVYVLSCLGLEKLAMAQIEKQGAKDLHRTTERGEHILHATAFSGLVGLRDLLLEMGMDKFLTDEAGQTMMHFAAQGGQKDMVQRLVSLKLSSNTPGRMGLTPLHYAAKGLHGDVINALLRAGADANSIDIDGLNPLDILRQEVTNKAQSRELREVIERLEGIIENNSEEPSEDSFWIFEAETPTSSDAGDDPDEHIRGEGSDDCADRDEFQKI